MKIVEFDIIFLSYDEPNADVHYADLLTKAPWAKRVHGVKGSDAAHKAAANLSDTEWFITVDADNIVHTDFFDLDLDMSDPRYRSMGGVVVTASMDYDMVMADLKSGKKSLC